MKTDFKGVIDDSFKRLDDWLVKNNYKAYDPFDGLSAKRVNKLTFNNHYLRIVLQQSVRRFPINMRNLLGVEKATSSKGMGFCAFGYLKMYEATKDETYLKKAKFCFKWLKENYSEGYSGYAWGNHFSYESRGGGIRKGIPTIVWTSLISHAFLNAFELLGDQEYFDIASSAGTFIMKDIARYNGSPDSHCLMYTPAAKPGFAGTIHNSNVLAAGFLARLYKHNQDESMADVAKKAVNYTVNHQLPEGGWYYGEPKKFQWEDSFHTGYNLESIFEYLKATDDKTHEDKLIKGYRHFIKVFFKNDGTPKYYDYKTYPLDIQCASQAIQTLVRLKEYDSRSVDLAEKVALWTVKNMQDREGYFYFRKYPLVTNKTPMFHWGQATMLSGLGYYLADKK